MDNQALHICNLIPALLPAIEQMSLNKAYQYLLDDHRPPEFTNFNFDQQIHFDQQMHMQIESVFNSSRSMIYYYACLASYYPIETSSDP